MDYYQVMESKYIRFGKIPASGRSMNSMDNSLEAGVSCYRIVRIGKEWRIDGAWGSYMMLASSGLPLYEITGDVVGIGADGEPLLSNVSIVRKMRKLGGISDCWNILKASGIGPTEKVYQHVITGEMWCVLSGVEFRCTAAQFRDHLTTMAPRRAGNIVLA